MPFFRFSFPILFAASLLAAGACSPSAEETNFDDFIEMELAHIRTQAGLPSDTTEEKTVQKFDEMLREIECLDDLHERDRRYSDAAGRLIVEARFDDAVKVSEKIRDEKIRDALLEDIVRFRMQAALQTFQQIRTSVGEPPEGILQLVHQATETGRKIGDPFKRAETLGNIALFRLKIKDRTGAVEMIRESGDALKRLQNDDRRKVRGLHYIARWILRQGENDEAYDYCKEAEKAAMMLDAPSVSAVILLDLSSFFTLLNKDDDARNACALAAAFVDRIDPTCEKAASLLKLAEIALVARMKEKTGSPAGKLLAVKQYVLNAAEIIAERPETESKEGPLDPNDEPSFLDPLDGLSLPDWDELIELKNKTLCRIAKMQVWGAPLEDVWETVQDIDEGRQRDEALIAAIEMLLTTEAWEDAEAWTEEIADPLQKREWNDKVKAAKAKDSP